jgi:uncharacterized membrane protein
MAVRSRRRRTLVDCRAGRFRRGSRHPSSEDGSASLASIHTSTFVSFRSFREVRMRLSLIAALVALPLFAACGRTDTPASPAASDTTAGRAPVAGPADGAPPAEAPPTAAKAAWHLVAGSDGTALAVDGDRGPALRLWCTPGGNRLRVNVPGFTPIASEERMSFGQGGVVVALVAGASGDATRAGVTAETALPSNLDALLSGPVTATYGAQVSGPHPVPSAELVSRFVGACGAHTAANGVPAAVDSASTSQVSACLVQDGRPVPANRLRAVGTEPFWGALMDGRCVTYSQPDAPAGTRVWTRFSGTAEAGTWTGALDGRPFVLRTRPQPGCSDGMSDRRYPIAVSLTVGGGERSGCAAPR